VVEAVQGLACFFFDVRSLVSVTTNVGESGVSGVSVDCESVGVGCKLVDVDVVVDCEGVGDGVGVSMGMSGHCSQSTVVVIANWEMFGGEESPMAPPAFFPFLIAPQV
jgi:hypothetical protein